MLAIGAGAAGGQPAGAGAARTSPYYGRWTVAEERPVFTARGRMYKTIDIAPCGRDFCGVSVDDAGRCGPTLFRFLSRGADAQNRLQGRGRWGEAKKTIEIYPYELGDPAGGHAFELYLGDGHDFGGRSDNMPKFQAEYRRQGSSSCAAR